MKQLRQKNDKRWCTWQITGLGCSPLSSHGHLPSEVLKEVPEDLNHRQKVGKNPNTLAQSKKVCLGKKFPSMEVIREVAEILKTELAL